ncbi:MAG TPA: site-specific DNA-methyltransferase [Acidimicrobiales bacterium]|nr:site-specific DNA-methyltransferase [Acidimicrobiales bacterium]
MATSTSNFGVGRREAHDASAFYARFEPPELSSDDVVAPPYPLQDAFVCGDARNMTSVADGSVALVVTSPPYYAGKQYEEELGRAGVPTSYLEYLELLRDVFAECKRTLEPGGRIAVNVANLGRKPYRSLAADVTRILQDDLKLLLRGEVVWRKGEGASGSCAWGSFRSAANPVLRDLTERVVIASKGRFDRAKTVAQRAALGLPSVNTMSTDEFMAATLDVWEIPAESARRVRHPAPFPVELPERLVRLYTYEDDLVLDPFMGSGSALVAAARLGRRYVGYDLDPEYVAIARRRVAAEGAPTAEREPLPAFDAVAEGVLADAGFAVVGRRTRVKGAGAVVPLVAADAQGRSWFFDTSGGYTTTRNGLARMEAVWRALGRAHVLAAHGTAPLVLLTSHLPRRGSQGDQALRAGAGTIFDVIDVRSEGGAARLAAYARGGAAGPLPGFWDARLPIPGGGLRVVRGGRP